MITELRIYLPSSIFTYMVGKPCVHHHNQVVTSIEYCCKTDDEPACYFIRFGDHTETFWMIENIAGVHVSREPKQGV